MKLNYGEQTEVGSIVRSNAAEIKVQVYGNGGEKKVDVRIYLNTEKYDGPTKQGFRLTLGEAEQLVALIEKALKNGG